MRHPCANAPSQNAPAGDESYAVTGGQKSSLERLDLVEGDGGVGEALGVDLAAGADQVLDRVGDVPDVDVHAGEDAAVAQPERDELAGRDVAAVDDLVVAAGAGVPGVLHAE